MASATFGINGTNIKRIFDGICVKTMVLINPIFDAIRAAVKAEIPARTLAPKKMLPSKAGCTLKRT
jgi:hypothetical protein